MFLLEWPWLLLILPLPALMYFTLPAAKQQDAALKVPFFNTLAECQGEYTQQNISRPWTLALLSLIWFLLVVATCRPQWIGDPISLPTSARDVLLAVDISGSMETKDMVVKGEQIPRINVVKVVVGDFVERRQNDRLGLILFGTQAYLQAPLTFDRNTVQQLLKEAQLGFAGEKTAIGDAIGLAIKRLRQRPVDSRVLILLTDGANTAGEVSPQQAADLAQQAGIKIYTIGVGADEMLVSRGLFGSFRQRINPSADLDEATLEYIANTTGGRYFRARNPKELLDIYALLDELEPIEQDAEVFRPRQTLYYWPLGIAMVLSLLLALKFVLPPMPKPSTGH